MSNKVGDRYSCSDPDCGCEIEIERPCNMLASESDMDSSFDEPRGSSGGPSLDLDDAQVVEEDETGDSSETRTASAPRLRASLTCFCGSEMQEMRVGNTGARSARIS